MLQVGEANGGVACSVNVEVVFAMSVDMEVDVDVSGGPSPRGTPSHNVI